MGVPRTPRREVWVVGVALAVIALAYRYAWLPNDPEAALRHAAETLGLPVTRVAGWFSAWTLGDGQVFAIIATDPLGLDEGWLLTQPAYRYGRAGYGWLAWVASLGQAEWVPYGMAIVGVVVIVLTFLLAVRLRPRLGPSAWLIVLNPAVLIAFAGDTTEGLGVLALAYALATGRWWASAALGVIRPDFLVALVGRWRLLLWGVLAAVTTGVLWIVRFGYDPDQYGEGIGMPIVGYINELSLSSTGLALLALATLVRGVRWTDWSWIATALFVLCFSEAVLVIGHNGWRVAGVLFVLWAFGPGYTVPDTDRRTSLETVANPGAAL